MKRKYYVIWGDFSNQYSLMWAPAAEPAPAGAKQISRKEAERLARSERARRKSDPAFSYFADAYIWPADVYDSVGHREFLARDDNYTHVDGYTVIFDRPAPDWYN